MSSPPPPPTKRVKLDDAPSYHRSPSQKELELAVGIAGYVRQGLAGWQGVFKRRYTDFLVNEIGMDGNVAHLTDLGGSNREEEEEEEEKKKERVWEHSSGAQVGSSSLVEVDDASRVEPVSEPKVEGEAGEPYDYLQDPKLRKLIELTDPTTAEFCGNLLASITANPSGPHPEHVTSPLERQERGLVHEEIRKFASGKIDSTTLTGDNEGLIRIRASSGQANTRRKRPQHRGGRNRAKGNKGNGGVSPDYCHFLVYKENRDTMEVTGVLPRLIGGGGKKNPFSFAGNKDRRAVTVSWFSAYRVRAERLARLNHGEGGLRGCKLGNFCYKDTGLELGDLCGNEFIITLRDCVSSDPTRSLGDVVGAAMESVRQTGFVNYFGLQRFGNYGVGTWEVGVQMLRSNWRGVVEKILDYDPAILDKADDLVSSDEKSRAQACHVFLTQYDMKKAAELIPRRSTAESAILNAFNDRGIKADERGGKLDYRAALQAVPRKMRTIYIHAFQSYVWNYVVTERIAWGTKVLPGDLVMAESTTTAEEIAKPATGGTPEVDQDGEVIVRAPVDNSTTATGGADWRGEEKFKRARALSEEEASSGKHTIKDVVLPTPGWDIIYPQNALMDVYHRIMKEHGLDPLDMKRNVKEISLPGSYRHVMGSFINGEASYEIRQYSGDEQIVKTDLDVLREKEALKGATQDGGKMEIDAKPDDGTEAAPGVQGQIGAREAAQKGEQKTAVVLRFKLGTSTYATMALREMMKDGVKAYVPEFGRA